MAVRADVDDPARKRALTDIAEETYDGLDMDILVGTVGTVRSSPLAEATDEMVRR